MPLLAVALGCQCADSCWEDCADLLLGSLQPWLFILCPQVVAFMKSPAGQYLDRHPFVALTLLVFVVVSAVPVGFFLLLVVLTSLAAFVGVMLLEGILLSNFPRWKMTRLGGQYWAAAALVNGPYACRSHTDQGACQNR